MGNQLKAPEAYNSYAEFFSSARQLAVDYGGMPIDSVLRAYARASMATNPYVQNRRVKTISSFPVDYGKDDIAKMLVSPDGYEQALRQTAHALEWSAYPYHKIRTTYQALNTYHYYAYPAYLSQEDAKSASYEREAMLVDKLNSCMHPDQWAHQIVGQAMQEGKVAYIPRVSVDKTHNQVNHAFLQQVPSDWWKIVGFNNISKYTVMFNMMYFMQPGADWRQFGDLFEPYLSDFDSILEPVTPVPGLGKKVVYNANGQAFRVDVEKFRTMRENAEGNPKLFNQNGVWAYWVTLPVDSCWVFEVDDATRTVATPLTGLFLAMDQIAAYEAVQLEIVQNPLISVALGEIPYRSSDEATQDDNYQLSAAGRNLFLAYWYEMLSMANTGGIGAYFAPVQNLHIESLGEAPNATDISTKGYAYAVEKSGLSGLIPVTDAPRAGAVSISAALEERYCYCIYRQMENLMNHLYAGLNLKYEWRFVMFGGFLSDEKTEKSALQGMQNGILSDLYTYLALKGRSVLSDLSMSRAVMESGVLDCRIPLVSSYTMKQESSGLPPRPQSQSQGGRPTKGVEAIGEEGGLSEGQEEDLDTADG